MMTFAQTSETKPLLSNACGRALEYFERAKGQSLDDYMTRIRPARVSHAFKTEVLANLLKEGEVQPSAKGRSKLGALEAIFAYHERSSAIDIKVFHAGQAFVGLHARSVLLISEEALDLLTAEELQASVAHEIGHDYFWREYQVAEEQRRYKDMQEIELRCDGIAIVTLHRLGLDPSLMISTVARMMKFNERMGTMDKAHLYTSLDERRRFNRAMIELVKASGAAPTHIAGPCTMQR
jgi:hypothetical protein